MNQVLIYNWFFDVAEKRQLLPPGFHTRLMQAVTGFQPMAADEAMRAHVQYGVIQGLERIAPAAASDWRLPRSHVAQTD
jgi:DNA-binding GntR family transcriptional regulator